VLVIVVCSILVIVTITVNENILFSL